MDHLERTHGVPPPQNNLDVIFRTQSLMATAIGVRKRSGMTVRDIANLSGLALKDVERIES